MNKLVAFTTMGFLLTVLFAIGSFSSIVFADGPLYVSTTGSDTGNCLSVSAPCKTVQYAINVSSSGDEIHIAGGTYTDLSPSPYTTDEYIGFIEKSLILRGGYNNSFDAQPDPTNNPTILNAQGLGRVFYIGGNATVILEGLNITGGRAGDGYSYSANGGAIYNGSATLAISDTNIYGNAVRGKTGSSGGAYGGVGEDGKGGAIYNYGVLTITHSSVYSNNAYGGNGGGGDVGGTGGAGLGGGIYNAATGYATGTIVIQSSTIKGNQAEGGAGGSGLYGSGGRLGETGVGVNNAGVMTITDSIVRDNVTPSFSMDSQGGGIGNTGQLWIRSSQIEGNQSFAGVGVLNRGTMQLDTSTIRNNVGFVISDNSGNGGGITNYGVLTMTHSTVGNNSSGIGGGVYNVGGGTANINKSTITSNTAHGDGGGVGNYGGNITISQSTIAHNASEWSGGGISNQGSCSFGGFGGPSAQKGVVAIKNSTISANTSNRYGGGIFNESGFQSADGFTTCLQGFTTINNATLAYNTAITDGGGLYTRPTTQTQYAAVITASNNIIASNQNNDCSVNANIISVGYNLDSDRSCPFTQTTDITNTNPLLGTLADNGGETETHALLIGSPAIDAGGNALCESVDQRGVVRPQNGICDIGAYEWTVPSLIIKKTALQYTIAEKYITYTLTVTNEGGIPATNLIITDTLPTGANYTSGGTTNPGTLVLPGNQVQWVVTSLAPNASIDVQFVVTATQTITNSDYRVSADGGYSATGVEAIVTHILSGVEIPVGGGSITPTTGTTVTIGSNTFTDTVVLNYTAQPVTATGTFSNIGIFYTLDAVYLSTGQPAQPQPGQTYTITVTYDEANLPAGANEADLALYYWDGAQWVKEPTSVVDTVANTITATPNHFSLWAALEASEHPTIYLPLVVK